MAFLKVGVLSILVTLIYTSIVVLCMLGTIVVMGYKGSDQISATGATILFIELVILWIIGVLIGGEVGKYLTEKYLI